MGDTDELLSNQIEFLCAKYFGSYRTKTQQWLDIPILQELSLDFEYSHRTQSKYSMLSYRPSFLLLELSFLEGGYIVYNH